MDKKRVQYILLRYLFLLIFVIFGLKLIYAIFAPITISFSAFFLNFFYKTTIINSTLLIGNVSIELIKACIAGSAYLLLVILNISTSMNIKQRVSSLVFALLAFLFLNVLRITIFSLLFINNFEYFDITHKIFWHFVSAIMLVFIWLLTIKLFHIKEIPFYTDLAFLYKLTKNQKKKKK